MRLTRVVNELVMCITLLRVCCLGVLEVGQCECECARQEDAADSIFEHHRVVTREAMGIRCAIAADLDGDGDMDVVTVSSTDNTVAWYERLPDGRYSPKRQVSFASNGARSVTASDVDGDGDVDLIVGSYDDHTVGWFENDGAGKFSSIKRISTTTNNAQGVFAADIDGDGDTDIVSASSGDNTIAWFENLGMNGSFCEVKRLVDRHAVGARTVVAADLDGDGDLDLASASKDDNTIAWYPNIDGRGLFPEKIIISDAAHGAYSVVAVDLNQDGAVDLVTASNADDTVAFYRNEGNGTFHKSVIFDDADFVLSVFAADFDADGDIDVASASYFDGAVRWYENLDGLGTRWVNHTLYNKGGAQAHFVFGADIDGDGDTDLLAAIKAVNSAVIFYVSTQCDDSMDFPSKACCRLGTQWNGTACVQCSPGYFGVSAGSSARCQACPHEACHVTGFPTLPPTCRTSIAPACSDFASAIANCDCAENAYKDAGTDLCHLCPHGHVKPQRHVRTLKDYGDHDGDGTLDIWAGFEETECVLEAVLQKGSAPVEDDTNDGLVIVLVIACGLLIIIALILSALHVSRRRGWRLGGQVDETDEPNSPATPTGREVQRVVGPRVIERLQRSMHCESTLNPLIGKMSHPHWIVNASPFNVSLQDHKGIVRLEPESFCKARHPARRKLRVTVTTDSENESWKHLPGNPTEIHVGDTDWARNATTLDNDSQYEYDYENVRRDLCNELDGQHIGQIKLTMLLSGDLVISWSPPHVLRGLPLPQFEDFLQQVIDHPDPWECRGGQKLAGGRNRNMYDACQHFIEKVATRVDASYAELYVDFGPATIFISHVWGETALHTLRAIQALRESTLLSPKMENAGVNTISLNRAQYGSRVGTKSFGCKDDRVWFCTTCNNQSRVKEELGREVRSSPFARVVSSPTCRLVAMVSPFKALERKWCNFEFSISRSQGKKVLLVTSEGVVQAGQVSPAVLYQLSDRVASFKSAKATCTSEHDEELIDAAVKRMGGYEAIDEDLRHIFREAVEAAHNFTNNALKKMHTWKAEETSAPQHIQSPVVFEL